jgi:hypothetical protein
MDTKKDERGNMTSRRVIKITQESNMRGRRRFKMSEERNMVLLQHATEDSDQSGGEQNRRKR